MYYLLMMESPEKTRNRSRSINSSNLSKYIYIYIYIENETEISKHSCDQHANCINNLGKSMDSSLKHLDASKMHVDYKRY